MVLLRQANSINDARWSIRHHAHICSLALLSLNSKFDGALLITA